MVRAKAEHRAPYDGDRRIRYRRKEVYERTKGEVLRAAEARQAEKMPG